MTDAIVASLEHWHGEAERLRYSLRQANQTLDELRDFFGDLLRVLNGELERCPEFSMAGHEHDPTYRCYRPAGHADNHRNGALAWTS